MLEYNRNLSSIVGAIQDEGPPAGESKAAVTMLREVKDTAGADEAVALSPARTGRKHSARRVLLYLLLVTLTVAAGFIFVTGSGSGYLAAFTYGAERYIQGFSTQEVDTVSRLARDVNPAGAVAPVSSPVAGERDVQPGMLEIHARQAVIMTRLEELTAAMADIKAGNNQYRAGNQGRLNTMQEDLQGKIDDIAATVAGIQAGLVYRETVSEQAPAEPNDIDIVQSESDPAPASGGWVVNVANSGRLQAIEKLQKKLHKHEIQAEIQEVTIHGKVSYRLRIPGFATRDEARDYSRNLDGSLGLKGPWVSKR